MINPFLSEEWSCESFYYHQYCVLLGLQQPSSGRMGAHQSHPQADLRITFTLMNMAGQLPYIYILLMKVIGID